MATDIETATALETQRGGERDATPAVPKAPPPPAGAPPDKPVTVPLGDLFDRIRSGIAQETAPAKEALAKAEGEVAKTFTERVKPAIEGVESQLKTAVPAVPDRQPFPSSPDITPRSYLSVETKNALPAIINGLGLLAQMFTGMRGAPNVALRAVTGAMDGWHQGDTERANRAWRTYLEQVDQIKYDNGLALKEWEAAMQQTGAQDARAQALLVSRLSEMKLPEYAVAAAKSNMHDFYTELTTASQIANTIESRSLQASIAQANHDVALANLQVRRDELALKRDDASNLRASYTPDVIQTAGVLWAQGKPLPAGLGRSGPQAAIRGEMIAAGLKWWKDQGRDPAELPAYQAEIKASQATLPDIRRRREVAQGAVGTFDKHMDRLIRLSESVERGKAPVINRYQLQLQGQYEGDADTAAYLAMANEAAQEYSKIPIGTAQGDASSREEARKIINGALNHEQLVKVAEQLKGASHDRLKNWDQVYQDEVQHLTGLTVAGVKAPAALPIPQPLPPGAKRDGADIVSESGDYIWRGGQWQKRQ